MFESIAEFAMKKFKPVKQEKTIISIRLDVDMLNAIDRVAVETDISRNEFIVQCIEYAIHNIDTDIQDK